MFSWVNMYYIKTLAPPEMKVELKPDDTIAIFSEDG